MGVGVCLREVPPCGRKKCRVLVEKLMDHSLVAAYGRCLLAEVQLYVFNEPITFPSMDKHLCEQC